MERANDWQERFRQEYAYTKRNYEKLHRMIVKYEAGTLDFKPNCPLELLKRQSAAMGSYLYVLEMRSEIEGIELPEDDYERNRKEKTDPE